MPNLEENDTTAREYVEQSKEDLSEPYSEVGTLMDALQEAFTGNNPSEQGLGEPK